MVLERRLITFVENNKLLGDWQAGFREGRGTMDNVTVLNTIIERQINKDRGKIMAFLLI